MLLVLMLYTGGSVHGCGSLFFFFFFFFFKIVLTTGALLRSVAPQRMAETVEFDEEKFAELKNSPGIVGKQCSQRFPE